jgi:hypothetical protein
MHLSVGLQLDAGAHLEVFEHGTVTSKHAREVHELIGFVPADGSGEVTGSPSALFTGEFDPVGMFPRVANSAGARTLPLRVIAVTDQVVCRA